MKEIILKARSVNRKTNKTEKLIRELEGKEVPDPEQLEEIKKKHREETGNDLDLTVWSQ